VGDLSEFIPGGIGFAIGINGYKQTTMFQYKYLQLLIKKFI